MHPRRPDEAAAPGDFVEVFLVGSVTRDEGVGAGGDGDVGFEGAVGTEEE